MGRGTEEVDGVRGRGEDVRYGSALPGGHPSPMSA